MTEPDLSRPYDLIEPAIVTAPILFNAPHSGRDYPARFLAQSRLDPLSLRRSEDAFIDDLFMGVVERGSGLMRARFPRAYLDVNREPYELDPRMFDGRLPGFANTRSLRVAGGLGTIARIVGDQQEIYAGRLSVADALERIESLYKPYHRTLRRSLARLHRRFGVAVLIDCHSMPSSGLSKEDRPRGDFVLGDRYGTSCDPAITDCVEAALRRLGHTVTRNKPYAGGYITEHYGAPAAGFHVLQIELNRALYMDEQRIEKTERFAALARDMVAVRDALAALPLHIIDRFSQAAE